MRDRTPAQPIDALYQADHFSNTGTDPRKDQHNEDRSGVGAIMTRSGLKLYVGVVCDGVGGRNKGEVAAVTAMETFVSALRNSTQPRVPQAIQEAITLANGAVREKGVQTDERIGCTLTAAVIHKDDSPWGRLYVANMGDSRVGLIRNKKLTWLTREHNVYTDSIFSGMPPEQARQLPNADHITRAMGAKPTAEVDLGMYHQITTPFHAEQQAVALGMMGLPLEEGDTLVCCSDGITEINPANGKPYLWEEEMARFGLDNDIENAVKTLRGYASGREPRDDNTLVMIFVAPLSQKRRAATVNRKPLFAIIGVISLIAVGLFMAFLASRQSAIQNADELTRVALEITQEFARQTEIALSHTPTPSPTPTFTPTPFQTLAPGQWGMRYNLSSNSVSQLQETSGNLQIAQPEKIDISYPSEFVSIPANFYIQGGSQINFTAVGRSIRLKFLSGDVFINSGQYSSVITELEFTPGIEFSVAGSCMALQYDQRTNEVSVWCFEGNCEYRNNFSQQTTPITTGTRVTWTFEPVSRLLTPSRSEMISSADAVRYSTFIAAADGASLSQSQMCINIYMPTPTPTITPTRIVMATSTPIIVPTNTPVQQNAPIVVPPINNPPINNPTATHTPVPPPATNTPVPPINNPPINNPTATHTPVPPPATNTPVPPPATNTPVPPPPTNTPVPPPPTNTPVPPPPTDTPVPPPPTDTPVPPPPAVTPDPPPAVTPDPPPAVTPEP